MIKKPNKPQTNDAVLGGQSPSSASTQCPICKSEYIKGKVNRCSVCNWDLTPYPEALAERQNAQLAWAREMWINLQAQEKQLHAEQSQREEVKQEKARFEGEVLHRLEKLEQAQDGSEPVIWTGISQDTSKVDELEKQLSRIKEQLKGAEREQQELKSEVDKLSAQVAEFEVKPQKKIANDPPLVSEAGIDYSRLQNFLAAGEWEKANFETVAIINTLLYEIAENCTDEKGIDFYMEDPVVAYSKWITDSLYYDEPYEKDICFSKNLRRDFCKSYHKLQGNDLDIIDKLWLKYSYGRFGFSVQKRLYELLQGDMRVLCEALSWGRWRKDDDYDNENKRYNPSEKEYSINAPVGHLPIVYVRFGGDHEMILYLHSLLENISSCGLNSGMANSQSSNHLDN